LFPSYGLISIKEADYLENWHSAVGLAVSCCLYSYDVLMLGRFLSTDEKSYAKDCVPKPVGHSLRPEALSDVITYFTNNFWNFKAGMHM
jgi:hypothetical protein